MPLLITSSVFLLIFFTFTHADIHDYTGEWESAAGDQGGHDGLIPYVRAMGYAPEGTLYGKALDGGLPKLGGKMSLFYDDTTKELSVGHTIGIPKGGTYLSMAVSFGATAILGAIKAMNFTTDNTNGFQRSVREKDQPKLTDEQKKKLITSLKLGEDFHEVLGKHRVYVSKYAIEPCNEPAPKCYATEMLHLQQTGVFFTEKGSVDGDPNSVRKAPLADFKYFITKKTEPMEMRLEITFDKPNPPAQDLAKAKENDSKKKDGTPESKDGDDPTKGKAWVIFKKVANQKPQNLVRPVQQAAPEAGRGRFGFGGRSNSVAEQPKKKGKA